MIFVHRLLPVLALLLLGIFIGTRFRAAAAKLKIAPEPVAGAETLAGLKFSPAQREMMGEGLGDQLHNYEGLRGVSLANSEPPALVMDILPDGFVMPAGDAQPQFTRPAGVKRPKDDADLAYLPVRALGELIRSRQISSEQLTRFYLDRIAKANPKLRAVITVTGAMALDEARAADREIAAGKYRGPLHGIPYGAKDLLAVPGYPTTWGAPPFKTQQFSGEATVIRRLREAGAVLIAKTSLGELAMDDVWFGGKTLNPWNETRGSNGSSAGSAAGVSAALFPFAIGSETWGSIVAPSAECGVTGLRPTFGRVPRTGAMALSWSMDKLGPICRDALDCAIIFNTLRGPDGHDRTVRAAPFAFKPGAPLKGMRIGVMQEEYDHEKPEAAALDLAALKKLRAAGAILVPLTMPKLPVNDMQIMLLAEAGAAFDELTRSGRDSELVQQGSDRWPNVFRMSRFIPAVEYIQASRLRRRLINEFDRMLQDNKIEVWLAPSLEGDHLLLTNLTGHPAITVPAEFNTAEGHPASITFHGRLFGEGKMLEVAAAWQSETEYHKARPQGY